jgi:uncharacterized protein (DUF2235 family)
MPTPDYHSPQGEPSNQSRGREAVLSRIRRILVPWAVFGSELVGRFILLCFVAFFPCFAVSSSTDQKRAALLTHVHEFAGDSTKPKNVFIFLDGTENGADTATNVWRLYGLVVNDNDPQMAAAYIPGVGTIDEPVSGAALGRGMEERILAAYGFIAQYYNVGDKLYIFGFSRGAHEARALAGLISYAGFPVRENNVADAQLVTDGWRMLHLLQHELDREYAGKWEEWHQSQAPVLAEKVKGMLHITVTPAEVEFVGVWDTVPGSSFKSYVGCKEARR